MSKKTSTKQIGSSRSEHLTPLGLLKWYTIRHAIGCSIKPHSVDLVCLPEMIFTGSSFRSTHSAGTPNSNFVLRVQLPERNDDKTISRDSGQRPYVAFLCRAGEASTMLCHCRLPGGVGSRGTSWHDHSRSLPTTGSRCKQCSNLRAQRRLSGKLPQDKSVRHRQNVGQTRYFSSPRFFHTKLAQ